MGRRRASKRNTLQRLHRIPAYKRKREEEFRGTFTTAQDVEDILGFYHETYILDLLAPWYQRLWTRVRGRWEAWRSDKLSEYPSPPNRTG